ncbi:LysR family transcriptional regulator [Paraburkholderia sp.]|uniref:LysR family transcriptional regulator n=1 Tax=Paraburkholderia sp. TaxID=1926495 RepID=UPI0025FB2452|nr:LysR family transcriptional regulator [Paraburkholderia sp.]
MNTIDIARVDLNLLKVFEALYEEGGAGRAAIRLELTQSAVSAALSRLRRVYENPLFTRTGRGLSPTARAHELKPVITEALDRCRLSLAMTAGDSNDFRGRSVSIGLSDDFEIGFGHQIMDVVKKAAPGLRLIFRQTHSQIVTDALLSGQMDLAIVSGGFSSRGLSRQILGEGGYACLVDSRTLLGKQRKLTLDAYVTRPHILVSSGGVVGIVDEALANVGRKRQICASTTHFAALPFLLHGSDAVATIPGHAAAAISRLTGLCLLQCPIDLPRYSIELGWRTTKARDTGVAAVRQAVMESFACAG